MSLGFGYFGLPKRRVEDVREAGMRCWLGVDAEIARRYGQPNAGAASALREQSVRLNPRSVPGLRGCDVGTLRGEPQQVAADLLALVTLIARRGQVPLVAGCDHTLSYFAARAAGRSRPAAHYVYLDAHLDLGRHEADAGALHNGNFVSALMRDAQFAGYVNVGARAPSTFEPQYDEVAGLLVVRDVSIGALEPLRFLAGREVYVSIDTDVLDPAAFPASCVPEAFGMMPAVARDILTWLGAHCTLIGADLSECMPSPDRGWAAETAVTLLAAVAA